VKLARGANPDPDPVYTAIALAQRAIHALYAKCFPDAPALQRGRGAVV
jgi:hypothetical protein